MARKSGTRSPAVRVVLAAVAFIVIVFAVEGGEWGTMDLFRQQRRLARLRHDVDSLRHDVDSLARYRHALETDPVLQEKIAREEFGMVRGKKELLYRFTDPDPRTGPGKARKP
jgi:cell division protein FtsB